MMHKYQAVLLGGFLTLALAACSSTSTSRDTSMGSSSSSSMSSGTTSKGSAGAGSTGYNDEGGTSNKEGIRVKNPADAKTGGTSASPTSDGTSH